MTTPPTSTTPVDPAPTSTPVARTAWYAVVALLALALAVLFFVELTQIRGSDAIYPLVVLVAFSLFALVSLVLEIRAAARAVDEDDATPDDDLEGRRGAGIDWPRIGMSAAAIVLAFVVLILLGYVAFVAVLCIALVRILGLRPPLRILLFAAITTVATYVIFVVALNSPMPAGILTGW